MKTPNIDFSLLDYDESDENGWHDKAHRLLDNVVKETCATKINTQEGQGTEVINFAKLSEALRDDGEIARKAVYQDFRNYQYVSDRLKESTVFLLDCIKNCYALTMTVSIYDGLIPKVFLEDDHVLNALLDKDPLCFEYLSAEARNNPSLIKKAIKEYANNFNHIASDKLAEDIHFCIDLLPVNPEIAHFVSTEMKQNIQFCEELYENSPFWFFATKYSDINKDVPEKFLEKMQWKQKSPDFYLNDLNRFQEHFSKNPKYMWETFQKSYLKHALSMLPLKELKSLSFKNEVSEELKEVFENYKKEAIFKQNLLSVKKDKTKETVKGQRKRILK